MNILHIFDNLYNGGAQRISIIGIDNLTEHSHHVIYLANIVDIKDQIKVPCTYIPQQKGLGLLSTIYKIRKYCILHQIEVINCSVFNAIFIGRLVALSIPRIKHITTYQGTSYMSFLQKSKLYAMLDKLTQRKKFFYIAVSKAVAAHVHDKVNKNTAISIIYNCIHESYFEEQTRKKFVPQSCLKFIFIGNNFPEKKVSFLIEVFNQLNPTTHQLHIMGGGMDEFINNEDEAKNKNVFFYGMQKINKALLMQYDIYIGAGIAEGCPLATIEAMTVGLPTCTANTLAYTEVTNNKGIYFNPYNVHDAVTNLENLYQQQQPLEAMSIEHYEYSKNFSQAIFVDKMRMYYKSLI